MSDQDKDVPDEIAARMVAEWERGTERVFRQWAGFIGDDAVDQEDMLDHVARVFSGEIADSFEVFLISRDRDHERLGETDSDSRSWR